MRSGLSGLLFLLDQQAVRAEFEAHASGQLVLLIDMIGDRGEDNRQHTDDQVINIVASHARPQIAPNDLLFDSLSPRGVSGSLDFADGSRGGGSCRVRIVRIL